MSISELIKKIREKENPTIAGLDPELSYVPEYIRNEAFAKYGKTLEGAAEALWQFNRGLIDALCDVVPAVKPQSAYYEMYGIPGIITLDKTMKYAREKGLYVLLDVKRGDIGKTAGAYSSAYIGETDIEGEKVRAFTPDGVTVNPYLGSDGIKPFADDANKYGKSIFVLVKTSNASSGELQDLTIDEETVFEKCAHIVDSFSKQEIGEYGFGNVGCVVGATYPRQAEVLRKILPNTFFLVPGYGAQGGGAKDVMPCFNQNGEGAIVNSSRGIMCAYKKEGCDEKDFAGAARREAINMKNSLCEAIAERKGRI
ncbi:MAG: orotidine-5'-phosphate decarboxylase [Clostridia bacterium]|nr:orotidine-5'-phosphate decarboxylase [Clostridia bacterium]